MSVLGAERDDVPDIREIVENNRELLETVAERDDRWGESARRMLREADDE